MVSYSSSSSSSSSKSDGVVVTEIFLMEVTACSSTELCTMQQQQYAVQSNDTNLYEVCWKKNWTSIITDKPFPSSGNICATFICCQFRAGKVNKCSHCSAK